MKCFCGKPATHHVKVKDGSKHWALDHARCEVCKERALNTYKHAEIEIVDLKGES